MFGLSKRIVAVGAAAILAVTALGTVALAADPPPTATPGATSTTTPKTSYGQVFVGKLASALGIDVPTLEAKIKQAASDTIDQAVANGDISKTQGDALKQRIQQSNGNIPFGIPGLGGSGRGQANPGAPAANVVDPTVLEKAVADKLGMSVADLQTQLKSGATLVSLAQAHNVQVQDLYNAAAAAAKPALDQAVTDGKLTQAQADQVYQQIQQGRYVLRGAMGSGAPTGGSAANQTGVMQAVLKAVADKLGITVADLQSQLQSGKTIAQLAQDHNVQVQDLYDAAATAAKAQLDQAVKDGKLTQAQEDQIVKLIQQGQYMLRGAMGGGPAGRGPAGRPVPAQSSPLPTPTGS